MKAAMTAPAEGRTAVAQKVRKGESPMTRLTVAQRRSAYRMAFEMTRKAGGRV